VVVRLSLRRFGLLGLLVRRPFLGVWAREEREGGRREMRQESVGSIDIAEPVVERHRDGGVQLLKLLAPGLSGADDVPRLGTWHGDEFGFVSTHYLSPVRFWGWNF